MKKIIIAACMAGALAVGMTACDKGAEKRAEDIPVALNDSINEYLGAYIGMDIHNRIANGVYGDSVSNDEILKGIQYILGRDLDPDYILGLRVGMDVNNVVSGLEEVGVDIDRDKVMSLVRRYMKASEVGSHEYGETHTIYSQLIDQLEAIVVARETKAREAQAAAAASNAKAEVQVDVTTPGSGNAITANDTITVKYKGMHLDGKAFDEGTLENVTPNGFIPGFTQGLMQLNKGAVATIVIPGELAYGANGVPQAGIGPDETLVFEVEILDVKTPAEK